MLPVWQCKTRIIIIVIVDVADVEHTDDELGGRLPSDLTQLDSTELRQFADVQSVNVPSSASLASMFSVTMTPSYDASYDDKQPVGAPTLCYLLTYLLLTV